MGEDEAAGISGEMVRELGIAPALVTEDDYAGALREHLRGIGNEHEPRTVHQPRPDHYDRVRERAYSIWEREGRLEGRALENWRQAEEEITAEGG